MIDGINAGQTFKLADLIDFRQGEAARRILAENDGMRLAVMAFDVGAALPAHAAPGDVLLFVLEGEAKIECGGRSHVVRAGENFTFAKGQTHTVSADRRMKMAVIAKLA